MRSDQNITRMRVAVDLSRVRQLLTHNGRRAFTYETPFESHGAHTTDDRIHNLPSIETPFFDLFPVCYPKVDQASTSHLQAQADTYLHPLTYSITMTRSELATSL